MLPSLRRRDDAGSSRAEWDSYFLSEFQVPDRRVDSDWGQALAAAGSSGLVRAVGGATEERCRCRDFLERPYNLFKDEWRKI